MGMPADYELLNPSKSYNHICQNVPVQTATDMATEVKEYLEGKRSMVDARLMFQYNHDKTHEIISEDNSSLDAFF
jgi:hypothetical protein